LSQSGKSRFRSKAVEALLEQNTNEEAATASGVSKRTILRWLREDDLREQYVRAKEESLKLATGILARNTTKAARKLAEVFEGKPEPHQAAIVAATTATLRLALDSFALESLDERIRRLESSGLTINDDARIAEQQNCRPRTQKRRKDRRAPLREWPDVHHPCPQAPQSFSRRDELDVAPHARKIHGTAPRSPCQKRQAPATHPAHC
jgi:hypothetical protein